MTHIDDWLDEADHHEEGRRYAMFVLEHCRLPAWKKMAFEQWMQQFKLFCTYQGKRYRCTGASSMGDVWLAKNFKQDTGYDHRVAVDDCSDWGPKP